MNPRVWRLALEVICGSWESIANSKDRHLPQFDYPEAYCLGHQLRCPCENGIYTSQSLQHSEKLHEGDQHLLLKYPIIFRDSSLLPNHPENIQSCLYLVIHPPTHVSK